MTAQGQLLAREHQQIQRNNGGLASMMALELGNEFLADRLSRDEFVAAIMAQGKLSHDAANQLAVEFIQHYRELEAPTRRHADPLLSEWDAGAAYGRVDGTLRDIEALTGHIDYVYEVNRLIEELAVRQFREALNAGRDTIAFSAAANGTRWRRIATASPCAFCALLATRSDYRTKESALYVAGRGKSARPRGSRQLGERYHQNCVIGSTIVDGPRTQAAYRRLYEGEVVVIVTTGGQELTVTPNHPVLTARGWVDAGELKKSDQLAVGSRAEWAGLDVPNEEHGPSAIQDVWGSGRMSLFGSVPVAAEDFHGDGFGTQGEVDVVLADRELADVFDSVEFKHLSKEVFAWATRRDSTLLPGASLSLKDGHGHGSPSGCDIGSGDLGLSLCRSHSGSEDGSGFAGVPEFDAEFLQAVRDDRSGYAKALCERLHGLTRLVAGGNLAQGNLNARLRSLAHPRFDPSATESITERRAMHSKLGGDLLQRLSGGVSLLGIRDLFRRNWSGHVYNLQTLEGWYAANGIIVSNCGCSVVEVLTEWDPSPAEQDQLDLYQRAAEQCDSDGVPRTEKNVLERMRQHGQGVIHDAHKPKTQTGGAGGGKKPPRSGAGPFKEMSEPPDPTDKAAWKAYWKERQEAIPLDFKGDDLYAHEVEAVERLLRLGQELDWIPRVPSRATNDFVWVTNQRRATELKSPRADHQAIRRSITEAVKGAQRHGVSKDVFLIDLGGERLGDDLRSALANYNLERERYPIAELWVMSSDGQNLERVPLNER